MLLRFILKNTSGRALLALAALTLPVACTKKAPEPEPKAAAPAAASAEAWTELLQAIDGRLTLVAEEYKDAVKGGEIINATEYEEAQMFAEQAALRARRLSKHPEGQDDADVTALAQGLVALMSSVEAKVPVAEVASQVDAQRARVRALGGGAVAPAVSGTRGALARAGLRVRGEQLVGGYRVGLVLDTPRAIYTRGTDGALTKRAPPEGATHYVEVLIREPRTLRFLPGIEAELIVGDQAVPLRQIWGEYQHYGAHLSLPADPAAPAPTLTLKASAPHYHRHGDMMGIYTAPFEARFSLERRDGALAVGGAELPEPTGYRVGDDVLQGLAESGDRVEVVGPYRIGFISEAPEPVWLWEGEGTELHAVKADDTHHLEIFLTEAESFRVIPSAQVSLTLSSEGGGEVLSFTLHPLFSAFFHYGATVQIPPGHYTVEAQVRPPSFDSLTPGLFDQPAKATFQLDVPGAPK